MTPRQLKSWLTDQLKAAEPLDSPSELENPKLVAVTATKKLGLLGFGNRELFYHATTVTTPQECAGVLVDCLAALPEDEQTDTLSTKDVAKILSVSRETVLGWINSQQLKASNIASGNRPRWIISREALDSFLKNRQPEPKPVKAKRAKSAFKRY